MADEQEPVAWAALHDDGDIAWIGYTEEGAEDGACGRTIVPLYRSPTLTDEEREAVDRARIAFRDMDHNDMTMQQIQDYEAICGLLERLG